MANNTNRKQHPAVKPEVGLTQQDAHNILMLLNRVQTKGIQEAQVLGYLANKLNTLRGAFTPEGNNGEDVS